MEARTFYLTNLPEEAELFYERDVTYYWDGMEGASGRDELNFLCANWKDFLVSCNPSAFVRSWGADCQGWPGSDGFNSAGLFGQMVADRRLTILDWFEVLFEMSRVRENNWAREMIAGLVRNYRMLDPETGDLLRLSFADQQEIIVTKGKVLELLSAEANEL